MTKIYYDPDQLDAAAIFIYNHNTLFRNAHNPKDWLAVRKRIIDHMMRSYRNSYVSMGGWVLTFQNRVDGDIRCEIFVDPAVGIEIRGHRETIQVPND
jgi:hypothetical protein